MKILTELEKPFDHVHFPAADAAFNLPRLPIRRRRDENNVEFKTEPQSSKPSIISVLDTTKCYGHREGYDMPRGVSEVFGSKALEKVAETSLQNPFVKKEYELVKELLEQGVHPVNISGKSTYVSSNKVLIKKGEARYLVEVSDTHADILGLSSRTDKKSIKKFEKLVNKIYDVNIRGY